MTDYIGVPADKIQSIWSSIAPLIQRATDLDHVDFGPEEVKRALLSRDAQLWLAGNRKGVCITRIEVREKRKVAVLVLVSGTDLESWKDIEGVFAEWAKAKGCAVLEATGRLGWKPIARELGYRPVTMTFRKEL